MAKKIEKKITCSMTFTEGSSDRLTKAFVDAYYRMKKYGTEENKKSDDKTA